MFFNDAYECLVFSLGVIAQLGERMNGIHEVDGSIPSGSTTRRQRQRPPGAVSFLGGQNTSGAQPRPTMAKMATSWTFCTTRALIAWMQDECPSRSRRRRAHLNRWSSCGACTAWATARPSPIGWWPRACGALNRSAASAPARSPSPTWTLTPPALSSPWPPPAASR
jgi:hypothetical protein